ncbi:CDP-glucose 4,6-dehydratase [Ekhidna sp.]|uniref:CDP-glucose 4,6-dehydratase n=1 Tax=Ekhidna sp. TaxID=2608089 RepID=UPI003B5056F1
MLKDYYKGKKVLVTGHTGFKGSWLCIWLLEMGAEIVGYALDPLTKHDNFLMSGLNKRLTDIRGDIRDTECLNSVFDEHSPEIVFHLAAQPLVRASYDIPKETYEVNVMGTINVLEAIRKTKSVKTGIMITTDKCYENKEQIWGYRESDPMGGHDPYSSSKGACEIAISSWRRSFFNPEDYKKHGKAIASVRAGNVIGGGDWSVDRLIPDCIKSIQASRVIEIRNPMATRPWEHVLDPLSGYLLLGQKMAEDPIHFSEGWNFGPDSNSIVTVKEIAEKLVAFHGSGKLSINTKLADLHEANLLSLDVTKARVKLGWKPKLSIDDAIRFTADWYKNANAETAYSICSRQIEEFLKIGE